MSETKQQSIAKDVIFWALLMLAVLGLSLIAIGPLFNILPKAQSVTFVDIFEKTPGSCPVADTSACGFSPGNVSIGRGKSLLFRNTGSLTHTVTHQNSTSRVPLFNATISSGEAYAFELASTPGTYDYYCMFHPWAMNGTITVG